MFDGEEKNNKESPEIVNTYRHKDAKREATVLKLESCASESNVFRNQKEDRT